MFRTSEPKPCTMEQGKLQTLALPLPNSLLEEFLPEIRKQGGVVFAGLATEAWGGADEGAAEAAYEMAWEQLHSGPWQSVPLVWRDAFSVSCLSLALCHHHARQLDKALRFLDLGVIMGGPRFRLYLDSTIVCVHNMVAEEQEVSIRSSLEHQGNGALTLTGEALQPVHELDGNKQLKRKRTEHCTCSGKIRNIKGVLSSKVEGPQHCENACTSMEEDICSVHSTSFSPLTILDDKQRENQEISFRREEIEHLSNGEEVPKVLPDGALQGLLVRERSIPPLEDFLCDFFLPGVPVIVTDAMNNWPALTRWKDFAYLQKVAGYRTVPVEVGEHYLAAGWKQELITLSQFLVRCQSSAKSATRPYLAQHPLFEQVPQLQADIVIPDYCSVGGGDMKSINAWLGPTGTITPLHHDPYHNLFAQVVGRKYVRLYPPKATQCLYPYSEAMLSNSSQVDLNNPEYEKFPKAQHAKYVDCILEEGQMLYIPPKWWHYVESLTPSFSVSFWWDL